MFDDRKRLEQKKVEQVVAVKELQGTFKSLAISDNIIVTFTFFSKIMILKKEYLDGLLFKTYVKKIIGCMTTRPKTNSRQFCKVALFCQYLTRSRPIGRIFSFLHFKKYKTRWSFSIYVFLFRQ